MLVLGLTATIVILHLALPYIYSALYLLIHPYGADDTCQKQKLGDHAAALLR